MTPIDETWLSKNSPTRMAIDLGVFSAVLLGIAIGTLWLTEKSSDWIAANGSAYVSHLSNSFDRLTETGRVFEDVSGIIKRNIR